jgi:chloride channel protein, CIC family
MRIPFPPRLVQAGRTLRAQGLRLIRRAAQLDESTVLIGFAAAIGLAVGIAVVLFYKFIDVTQALALTTADRLTWLGALDIMAVVLLGLVAAHLIVRYGARDSDGQNIPDVMRAVAKHGGHIPDLPVWSKTAAAGLLIGTGGNVGAEGPVAVAGAALGSRIGRVFRSGGIRLQLLVACGAAAGISAAFNAPIAGVFFALEKILGSFSVAAFAPVLVASVIAAVVSRAVFGSSPVIAIPTEYAMGPPWELGLYALLGITAGVVAVMFTRAVYGATDLLERRSSRWRQILTAALVVGLLDVMFRADLWGRGHESLDIGIIGEREPWFLIALAFAKMGATAFALGAARAGGVFTPALFIGATLGGGLARAGQVTFPGWVVQPEAFALAGMAGLVAGSTHAPLTAIMMVFEMSGDYELILPIMLTTALAYVTARRLFPTSLYSEWLRRKGERIGHGRDLGVLERLTVEQAFNRNPTTVPEGASLGEIMTAIGHTTQIEFPVLTDEGRLVGVVTYSDLRTVLADRDRLAPVVIAADIANTEIEPVTTRDSLRTALQRLGVHGTLTLPVVNPPDGAGPPRFLGLISRQEILAAYDRELLRETA